MDFKLSDEQELIVASYRDYMESENWETYFHECDEKHEYPLRWTQGLCELGLDRIMLDEEPWRTGSRGAPHHVDGDL